MWVCSWLFLPVLLHGIYFVNGESPLLSTQNDALENGIAGAAIREMAGTDENRRSSSAATKAPWQSYALNLPAMFSETLLQVNSYPFVLLITAPKEDVTQITSRFDVMNAIKVPPKLDEHVPNVIEFDARGESLRKSATGSANQMIQLSIMIGGENQMHRVLSLISELVKEKSKSTKPNISLDVDISRINSFKGKIQQSLEQKTKDINKSKPPDGQEELYYDQRRFMQNLFYRADYSTINGHDCFRNLQGMTDAMFDLANNYPDLVSVQDIGDSYLKQQNKRNLQAVDEKDFPPGYDIYVMILTAGNSVLSSSEKGKMLITTSHHPREYAPPELAMRFAETLVNDYDSDADITWIMDRTEIHIILYANPDGRYLAENFRDAWWRKNVNPSYGKCSIDEIGVDLNRNYAFAWGDKDGASNDPCDETFHGPSPFSEPETKVVSNYASNLFPTGQRKDDPEGDLDVPFGEDITGMYIDIHSYGGYTYYPWGFEDAKSGDDDALQALGRKVSSFNGYVLWAGGQPDFLYPASGDASDYMYAYMGVASFGLEIGDDFYQECNGFERTVLPDNLPALLYVSKVVNKPFSLIKGPDVFDLTVTSDGQNEGELLVTAMVSDSQMVNSLNGYPDHTTGGQDISSVQLYVDTYPDDEIGGGIEMNAVDGGFNSGEESVEFVLSTVGLSNGRHVLYVQAIDSDGYEGPVASAFFEVDNETSSPTDFPTAKPTRNPTAEPTKEPTKKPTIEPTNEPTQEPTKEPTLQPTTSQPTTSQPTTSQPTTSQPTTSQPTTSQPTTSQPTTSQPTTSQPTTSQPTTSQPTTGQPTTSQPTTSNPTTSQPTTSQPTTSQPTSSQPSTAQPTTSNMAAKNPSLSPMSEAPQLPSTVTSIQPPTQNPVAVGESTLVDLPTQQTVQPTSQSSSSKTRVGQFAATSLASIILSILFAFSL